MIYSVAPDLVVGYILMVLVNYMFVILNMVKGYWVIVILVLLIILACIGYCIWQRWGRKKTTQEQDQEKADFQQVPQNDTQK